MKIEDIKHMSKEHLQNFAEYAMRQNEAHVNCSPVYYDENQGYCWVCGWDAFGNKLEELLSDPFKLVDHLPPREE